MARNFREGNGSVNRKQIDQIHYHVPEATAKTDISPSTILADSALDVHNEPVYRQSGCLVK